MDMICRKTMTRCQTPGMCSPHGGCQDPVVAELRAVNFDYQLGADAASTEIARLKAEIDRLRTAEGDAMTYKAGMENVAQQRDQLKAEVETLRANANQHKLSMDAACFEIESLRKDAERYRFLRSDLTMGGDVDFCIVRKHWKAPALESILSLTNADEQIDSAMTK